MKKQEVKWYQKGKFLWPLSIVAGIFGLAALIPFIGVKVDDEFNEDYYKKSDESFFKSAKK